MKNLIGKKVTAFIAIALFSLSAILISACDPNGIFFKKEELEENVVKVELINYDNSEIAIVTDTTLIVPFNFKKMQILEVLPDSQFEEFIVDLSYVEMFDYCEYREFEDSAKGISLKVNYKNGDFILLSSNFEDNYCSCIVVIFDGEGEVKKTVGQFSRRNQYVNLINKYFETKIV